MAPVAWRGGDHVRSRAGPGRSVCGISQVASDPSERQIFAAGAAVVVVARWTAKAIDNRAMSRPCTVRAPHPPGTSFANERARGRPRDGDLGIDM